ncbi:putative glucosamine-6-phosphate deaminase [Bacteroides intestinalis CAG:315]|jgi:glucosamine-6-phosphate deaminase|uniref:Glucosamine-6-phosphate deaminase n=1 Tax=Bacteroides intestinalis TaxID=329854 RepID=A0A412YD44_9BACE|nr:6-phosphogluconolactonase [Bacteroides intestinalis]RGV55321.1 glucosamine-6-phosphate deaminase [Bacteroides intestinalis]RHA60538.1 glucosamine-6-phosphate deaminase [Bacteroides intestinalis]CDD93198.1 putative glucosamine-6-phosphate deaminase [Bacteroides intestinalis CAG:315]
MKITIAKSEKEFDCIAAWQIIGEILNKPEAVIGLSTGRTTGNLHRMVGEIYSRYPFNTSAVTFFGLDEVVNVPREYAGACYTMLKTEIIDALGIIDENFLMLPTVSDDFGKACRAFQEEIAKRGGIDLLILGLGENGHLGFNQPHSPLGGDAWVTKMNPELEERIRRETHTPPEKELGGVTLGIKNIMQARRIVLVAKGSNKAEVVKQMLEGPVTSDVPASVLQLHPDCEFLLDVASAAKLSEK